MAAQQHGADRIELCSRLDLDGLSPDLELIDKTLSNLTIPVKVMIRPRSGNFVYSESELESMENEIDQFKALGVTEVVFGVLNQKNEIDMKATARLAKRSSPMKVTFHKAIDHTPNILGGLETLKSIPGITSILTSGGKITALKGQNVLKEMIQLSEDQLVIIPAGQITDKNIIELHESIGASEYHGRRILGNLN